jgi:hypothetical protein
MSAPSPNLPPPIPVSAPPPIAEQQGDATGGIIPYKNPHALTAYYLGVFSVIPLLGFILGGFAFGLGISGLRRRKKNPIIRGSLHAWVGIICGGMSLLVHLFLAGTIVYGVMSHR